MLLIALAIANAVVAFGFSINVWVWYASIVPTVAQLLAFVLQYAIFRTLVRRNIRAKHGGATRPSARMPAFACDARRRSTLPRHHAEIVMREAVIVSTARTGLAKSVRGGFNMTHGAVMGGHAVKHAIAAPASIPSEVEDVFMGCALPEGATGNNIARASRDLGGLSGDHGGHHHQPLLLVGPAGHRHGRAADHDGSDAESRSAPASNRSRWCRWAA